MPEILVHIVEGRSAEAKKALMKDITDAVVKHFSVPPERVVVQIRGVAAGFEVPGRRPVQRDVAGTGCASTRWAANKITAPAMPIAEAMTNSSG